MVSTRRRASPAKDTRRDGAETSVTPDLPPPDSRPHKPNKNAANPSKKQTGHADGHEEMASERRLMEIIAEQNKRIDEQNERISELQRSMASSRLPSMDSPEQERRRHRREARHHSPPREEEGESHRRRMHPPFSDELMNFKFPKGWKQPTNVESYDGTTDPTEHLDAYWSSMVCHGAEEELMCRTFPLFLKKAALRWFTSLPPRSVFGWDDLAKRFLTQFITSRQQPKSSLYLAQVRQTKEETLRDFLVRFNKESVQVKDLDPKVALHLLVDALRPGPFTTSLAKKEAKTMDEFLARSEKFIKLEDFEKSRQSIPEGNKKDGQPTQAREGRERKGPKGRFSEYTPLNVPP